MRTPGQKQGQPCVVPRAVSSLGSSEPRLSPRGVLGSLEVSSPGLPCTQAAGSSSSSRATAVPASSGRGFGLVPSAAGTRQRRALCQACAVCAGRPCEAQGCSLGQWGTWVPFRQVSTGALPPALSRAGRKGFPLGGCSLVPTQWESGRGQEERARTWPCSNQTGCADSDGAEVCSLGQS